jgi:hypothetical protein
MSDFSDSMSDSSYSPAIVAAANSSFLENFCWGCPSARGGSAVGWIVSGRRKTKCYKQAKKGEEDSFLNSFLTPQETTKKVNQQSQGRNVFMHKWGLYLEPGRSEGIPM